MIMTKNLIFHNRQDLGGLPEAVCDFNGWNLHVEPRPPSSTIQRLCKEWSSGSARSQVARSWAHRGRKEALCPRVLPLKHEVCRKNRERKAEPHNGFVGMDVETLPSPHTADHPHLEENDRDGKAARHPLTVLANSAFQNEDQRNAGCSHPQRGVHRRGNTEGSGIAHAFLEKLNVKAERRSHEYTCDIDSADYAMELPETVAKPVGELHRAQKQGARTGDSMRQEPPLEWLVVLPYWIFRMHQETLIVRDDVGQHQADCSKEKIFWTPQRDPAGCWRCSRAGEAPNLVHFLSPLMMVCETAERKPPTANGGPFVGEAATAFLSYAAHLTRCLRRRPGHHHNRCAVD